MTEFEDAEPARHWPRPVPCHSDAGPPAELLLQQALGLRLSPSDQIAYLLKARGIFVVIVFALLSIPALYGLRRLVRRDGVRISGKVTERAGMDDLSASMRVSARAGDVGEV